MSIDFEEVKRKANIYDVATKQLGLTLRPVGNGEYRGVSIAPGSHSTDNAFSLNIDTGQWYDFSANTGGSVLDLVAYKKFNGDVLQAARFLDGNSSSSDSGGYWTNRAKHDKSFAERVEVWHKKLLNDEKTLEYLHGRRITDATIERFKLGYEFEPIRIKGEFVKEWRLMCPYLDRNGKPVYAASRRLDWEAHADSPKYHKLKQTDFLKNTLFGLNTLRDSDTLVIGEGMVDALSFAQEGYAILFSIGGSFGKDNTAQVISEAAKFRRIITCYDIDGNLSGQRFTCAIGRELLKAGIPFRAITNYGAGHKDVSDYYTAGGDLRELLEHGTTSGYAFMSRFTFWEKSPKELDCLFDMLSKSEKTVALAEVKKFVYRLRSFLSEMDFTEVMERLGEYYPKKLLEKFSEGPTAQEVLAQYRDEFLQGRHVFYQGSIRGGSYWQYHDNGYWIRETDAAMQGEISRFFNHERTVKDIRTLADMVRLKDTRLELPDFNSQRLWLFQNGVLELDTGTLREPTPDDNLTWQVGYRYEPEAACPSFDTFIKQVACGDESRENLLDDMLGYILYEDNRLEKIFVLIGDGMNGKGTFLSTVEALAKSVNNQANMPSVSNVPLKDFSEPTQLMMLNGSLVNLSYDLDQNLKDCEGALKSVASGDTINGNRKFCDSVSFKPRCKLINASNHMIRVRDTSYGMRRKLAFCKFDACFKDRPNTNLKTELMSELSGIFNRMYRAYKALLEREKTDSKNAIRLCIDQSEFMAEFTQTASPVAAFWAERGEDYMSREVKKADIFDKFKEWCERNGRYAGDERIFFKSLKSVITDSGGSLTERQPREGGQRIRCISISSKPEPEAKKGSTSPSSEEAEELPIPF